MKPIAMPAGGIAIQTNAQKMKLHAMNFSLHLGLEVFIFLPPIYVYANWRFTGETCRALRVIVLKKFKGKFSAQRMSAQDDFFQAVLKVNRHIGWKPRLDSGGLAGSHH